MGESRSSRTSSSLREWSRELRRELPPILPIEVRRSRMRPKDHGDCDVLRRADGTPYKFRVRINSRLDAEAALHVLAHEWAHALSWSSDSTRIAEHSPEWGLAMAHVWNVLGGE